ncbi:hypothetical protein TeGR_g7165, partial [Tetraparma gracilis]
MGDDAEKLEHEKDELQEEVRLKKHSEDELKVMVAALESVSKERQDELREVMIDGKELKIGKLLGKGGFGVVHLATYHGGKIAVKQLSNLDEENVLRFRHECFLMKNLSHPNIVTLLGVVWSEEMFACCLEFVENGSMEDWLRRTVGGKTYIPPQPASTTKGKKIKKKPKKKKVSLAEATFKGFNHSNEAQNLGGTMTRVGTPIYIAPEVMRADHYNTKADSFSYGLCLVAMIRAERTLELFFYQALRKHKKRRTTKGLGMGQMTKYYYQDGWRPLLPLAFVQTYPKLHALIQSCWAPKDRDRPTMSEIVSMLQGEVGDEIKRKDEPKIEVYSKEDDEIYRGRIGKDDEIEESDEEEEGGKSTRRGGGVSKAEFTEAMAAKDKAMAELKNKSMTELKAKSKAMRELQ